MLPLEAVPELLGRPRPRHDRRARPRPLGAHARLLDVHADADHHRSVFTLVGSEDELVAALLAGSRARGERIDLRRHEGAHPRIGAADVVPIVPIRPGDLDRARGLRRSRSTPRIAEELGLPVFLYGELAPGAGRRSSGAAARTSSSAGSTRASSRPTSGRARLDPAAGGVIVGARRPLIAFNVNLRGAVEAAREIAALVRERGGGFPGVRALGLDLPRAGLVQVSMNVEDWEAAALHEIVARDRARRPRARGAEVVGSELVGLMPAGAAAAAAGAALGSTASTSAACSSCDCSTEQRSRRARRAAARARRRRRPSAAPRPRTTAPRAAARSRARRGA